jgi:rhamnogalacturonyl hydrolase YesR
VSLGYFPCDSGQTNGWRPSYPETTGYIIPSLLEFSERLQDENVRQRALRMATWEIEMQMASGAVQGGPVCARNEQKPAVFNTGMVLHGYTAAYRANNAAEFLEAGKRAADFLLADLDDDGHFRTHGPFVTQHRYKTYNCLCAWPLYRFGQDIRDARYQEAAVKVVDAALRQQQANGWFANNCLSDPKAPLSHTIAYTLQGVLEVGILADREDFIAAAQRGTDPLLQRISPEGFLHGSFFADWRPASYSSCLTGNAQLAVVCYRLHEQTGDSKYKTVADRLVNYLKALQVLDSDDPAMNGAIPGSFPLMGSYMTAGYPNWATKYFLDALLLQDGLKSPALRALSFSKR